MPFLSMIEPVNVEVQLESDPFFDAFKIEESE
jgi:hypothetical protein